MKTFRPIWIVPVLLLVGCSTVSLVLSDEEGATKTLQKAMDANHKATITLLRELDARDLPYRIEDGVYATSFTKADLSTLAPEDIAAWDKILDGLDCYCDALATLASGKETGGFVAASQALGSNSKSLMEGVKAKGDSYAGGAGEAVAAIGGILIEVKADEDVRAVAAKADPKFQTVIDNLVSALGYDGSKPDPLPHGIIASYEAHFETHNAANFKEFKDGTIVGFDAMTPDQKRDHIRALVDWLKADQDHDDFIASVRKLVEALNKAEQAHHSLATGTKESFPKTFAELKADTKLVQGIYEKFTKQ
jgi:hypothetical protein